MIAYTRSLLSLFGSIAKKTDIARLPALPISFFVTFIISFQQVDLSADSPPRKTHGKESMRTIDYQRENGSKNVMSVLW